MYYDSRELVFSQPFQNLAGVGSNPYTVPPEEATALVTKMVKKAMAAMGDKTLGGICMDDLVELEASAARQLGMYPAFIVGMTGSILNKVALTREIFVKKAVERFPRCSVVQVCAENVEGALFLAERL